MKDLGNIELFKNLLWLFFVLYVLAYFLPVSEKVEYGYLAAYFATFSMLDGPGLFVGGLANFVIAFLLLSWLISSIKKYEEKTLHPFLKVMHLLFIPIAIISVGIWPFIWDRTLLVGYYVWTISTVGMTLTHWKYRTMANQELIAKQAARDAGDLSSHLVE